jgi:ribose 5-phosphate isomerase B
VKATVAISSDERTQLTDAVAEELQRRGYRLLVLGALQQEGTIWTEASRQLALAVARGEAEFGVLFCYTGTGASIVANKIAGIRAALCGDAATAAGARRWNDANVLVLSLRATSSEVAREIVEAWLSTPVDPEERETIAAIAAIERGGGHPPSSLP